MTRGGTDFINCPFCPHQVRRRFTENRAITPSATIRLHEQMIAHIKREHLRKKKVVK